MRLTAALLMLAIFVAGVSCSSPPAASSGAKSGETGGAKIGAPVSFTDSLGRTYDAQLRFPRHKWNRHAVLLLGGGSVTDMHWTVPATVAHEGREIPLTSTGEPTRDADDLAAAFLDKGFAVFQYSSIHRDDATHAGNPAMADHVSYPQAREIARRALETLRAMPRVDPERIVLVGHSLGAARALQIESAEPGPIRAMALLAPAYVSRLGGRPSLAAQPTIEALIESGVDPGAGLRRHEWRAKRAAVPESIQSMPFDAIDRDRDEALRRWEIAGALILASIESGDPSDLTAEDLFAGETFPADALLTATIPTLLVFGGLDDMTVHAPLIERAVEQLGFDNIELIIAPHRGHNLSPEVPRREPELAAIAGPNLVAPIDPRLTKLIADWLESSISDE